MTIGNEMRKSVHAEGEGGVAAPARRLWHHRFLAWIYPWAMWVRNPLRHQLGHKSIGVCAIIRDDSERVLLVKHSYRPGWCLPGGGLKRGETPVVALRRELREELGLDLTARPRLVQIYLQQWFGMTDYPILFEVDVLAGTSGTAHIADVLEIIEIGWFPARDLPADTHAAVRVRIAEWLGERPLAEHW